MNDYEELSGGQPKNFLRPSLLVLLLEGPAHGYELLERLKALGFFRSDPGGVYRTLRVLEHEGLVRSAWDTSTAGPARRTYTITPEGEDELRAWAAVIDDSRRTLEQFLDRYTLATGQPVGQGRATPGGHPG
ncbi:MAG: helix-turn-helix transcriptional regulator [Actinomycetota bacterium]